jgi:hypothetical protein
MRDQKKTPYQKLGASLKSVRLGLKESIVEASGAVEINPEELRSFEYGEKCPSEDVLLLLISHFDVSEDEATRLWELAGYDKHKTENDEQNLNKQPVFVLPMDARIVYSDKVQVMVNEYGVVMNFMQHMGPENHMPVSRVGMSREHAEKVLQILKETLREANNPKKQSSLPIPKGKKDSSNPQQ